MAVVKSFDLEGNKQSFAGWISNLSPCDTPFVSMVNKEATSQTQYSWQFDTLDAPSKVVGYEEGSDAVPQVRGPTLVDYNFTQTLRKVVNISDTVSAMGTHGRNSEVAYQMGKSGKELKRDMEFMFLNNTTGNVGSKDKASKLFGFQGLCANQADPSTGALVTKEIYVADLGGAWFKSSDIFDVTYNLYLAGSKANKIMFHPRHALSFSQFMSKNIEGLLTYRMFEGLSDEFNTKVSTLRDPLGQKYDLIPNRFMPEDAIYFFNEDDWTQMILRQPSVSPLSKKGSSERFLMEAEVGLRHRNPFASGVLLIEPSNYLAEWIQKPNPLTWGINDNQEAEVKLTYRSTGQPVPDATEILWSSSNPAVVLITDPTGHTNAGKANVLLKPLRAGTSVITAHNAEGHASYVVTVGNPNVHLTLSNSLMEKDGQILAVVKASKADGTPMADGTVVNFVATPGHLVNLPQKSNTTSGGTGVTQVEVNGANALGIVEIQASVGTAMSNRAKLDIVEKVEELIVRIDQRDIANGINDSSTMVVMVVNALGVPIPNQAVTLLSTNTNAIVVPSANVNTGASGEYSVRLTASGEGDTVIVGQYKGQDVSIPMAVSAPVITLTCPAAGTVNVAFAMSASVTRGNGTTVPGVDVSFTGDPAFSPAVSDVATDAHGVSRASYTPTSNSDIEITASAGAYASNVCNIAVALVP